MASGPPGLQEDEIDRLRRTYKPPWKKGIFFVKYIGLPFFALLIYVMVLLRVHQAANNISDTVPGHTRF
jgi:hypothetical protein